MSAKFQPDVIANKDVGFFLFSFTFTETKLRTSALAVDLLWEFVCAPPPSCLPHNICAEGRGDEEVKTAQPRERASLVAQTVKNLPAVWETWV